MTPYTFQRIDLDRLNKAGYIGLINAGTGSGKTALTCWAIQESGAKRVLILAPLQTIESAWLPTVRKILGVEARVIGNGNKSEKQAMEDFLWGYEGVFICTHQLFARSDVSEWRGDFLAVDEAHANGMATPRSKAQKKLSGFTPWDDPISRRFPMRLALSGTVLRNRFSTAWSHSRFLWPELNGKDQIACENFWLWQVNRMTYREIYTNQRDRNGNPKKVKDFLGESVPGKWMSEAPTVITHFKRERCCSQHPAGYLPLNEPTVEHITVPLATEQRKAIAELEAMLMTWIEENPLTVESSLTKLTRIRQFALGVPTVSDKDEVSFDPECKSPLIDRIVDDLTGEYETENVAIYTDSQRFAEVLTHRINKAGVPAFEYSGKTKSVRDANLAQFGSKYRVVVGVIAALSEGLDGLQRVCKTEFWANASLDETLNEQLRGRLDRIGQTGQVERRYYHDDLDISRNRLEDMIAARRELNRSLRTGG